MGKFLEYILKEYRWVVVIFFLLPSTFLYELYYFVSNQLEDYFKDRNKQHHQKVNHIQKQIRLWAEGGKQVPMCTSRPGWKSMTLREPKYKQHMFNIDIGQMDAILELNETRQTVTVEPYVTMGQLTKFLIARGWTIPVVVELDDITVGGIIVGQGLESSSHKYGVFQNTCTTYEIVTADGNVVQCSKDFESDLFYAIPWSYGTLGFLTSATIQIIPVKKYVHLQYIPLESLHQLEHCLEKESLNIQNDFVEVIMFTEDHSVLMIGKFADEPSDITKINKIGRWYKPWFFEHVKDHLNKKMVSEEFIPIREYYHRHSMALFWEIQDIVPFGNNPLFRYLLGWLMPPKISFLKLTQTETIKQLYDKYHVVEDFLIPLNSLKPFIKYLEDTVRIYPIWLCPFLLKNIPGLVHPAEKQDCMYLDIGIYGEPKVKEFDRVKSIEGIEEYLHEINGFQMLYAGIFQSKEEFYKKYDHSLYWRVRSKFSCDKAFPEVYGKVNRKVRD